MLDNSNNKRRGRPAKGAAKRSEVLMFRVTQAERTHLKDLAARRELTVAQLLRHAIDHLLDDLRRRSRD